MAVRGRSRARRSAHPRAGGEQLGLDDALDAVGRGARDRPSRRHVDDAELAAVSVKIGGMPFADAMGQPAVRPAALESLANRLACLHGDVHPANLIWDGSQVWLVDWERAGLAHPYRDMATFANLTNLSDDDALGLLAMQEGGEIGVTARCPPARST